MDRLKAWRANGLVELMLPSNKWKSNPFLIKINSPQALHDDLLILPPRRNKGFVPTCDDKKFQINDIHTFVEMTHTDNKGGASICHVGSVEEKRK